VSAVFVPNKDGINHSKLSSVSRMMKFTGSTKVLDLVQDLEAAIRPENGIPHNHIDETHNNSTVFVPKKWSLSPRDSIRKGEKAKAATSNFMMRRRTHLMVDSSKEANVDNRQDLEAGTRPENGIAENEGDMEHGKLLIVVRDSGVGMSEENQKRLFHEVVQFNPEVLQAGGGSGLGLWITNNIVNMHDGKVSVRYRLWVELEFR
jgi:signal transduction histidine kinase